MLYLEIESNYKIFSLMFCIFEFKEINSIFSLTFYIFKFIQSFNLQWIHIIYLSVMTVSIGHVVFVFY